MDKWKALEAEGWTYKLWTDEDNRNLIKEHYPWFLEQFDRYEYGIQRADAVRYFILHKYGGVYSDLDIQPKANFGAFHAMYEQADVALTRTKAGNAFAKQNFSNCFMMSSPESAFWPQVWERLQDPFKDKGWKKLAAKTHYFHILFTTGPGVVNDAAEQYGGEVVGIPNALVQPGVESDITPVSTPESVVELLDGESWQQKDARPIRALGEMANQAIPILAGISAVLFITTLTFFILWRRARHVNLTTRPKASLSYMFDPRFES